MIFRLFLMKINDFDVVLMKIKSFQCILDAHRAPADALLAQRALVVLEEPRLDVRLAEAVPARERHGCHEEVEADGAGELVHVRGRAHLRVLLAL